LTVADSAANSPQLVTLSGSGIDFSMPSSGGTASIAAGSTATYQLSIGAVGGNFSSAVNLACAGVPAFSTCTVAPTSVTPGSSTTSVTVSIKTSGPTAQLATPGDSHGPFVASLIAAPGFGLMGLFFIGGSVRRKQIRILTLVVVLAMLSLICIGCAGVSTPKQPVQTGNSTPAGAYTVLVIGSSGSVQHFSSLTLTVH
jgi:hypothetical protein